MLPALLAANEEQQFEDEIEEKDYYRQLQLFMRVLRDNSDPFYFPNRKFMNEFRLNKYLVRYLIDEVKNVLPPRRSNCIAVEIKVFSCLAFYATGSYQRVIGSIFYIAISQSKMSRILHEITFVIYRTLVDRWIKFPQTEEKKRQLSIPFLQVAPFPFVFCAVDGIFIQILAPPTEEHNYVDRKGNHSKNVQVVCDYFLRILSINSPFGGSSHDAFIWRHSQVQEEMRQHYRQGSPYMILGDSGYPVRPWLLTPIRNAEHDSPEYRYTLQHSRARSCVERCIGVMKHRFQCISHDNVMRYDPAFIGIIITVIAALHNMCIAEGLDIVNDDIRNDDEDNDDNNDDEEDQYKDDDVNDEYREGVIKRQNIIENYFS